MSTMNVLDSAGATVAVEKPLIPGQALMAASRPVVIASDQSAVPVSGTVSVSGTIPVSGTFWQATQPVSIATMPSTPVTGTFWQATQPVSFTQQALPANQSVNASQINGVTPLMGNGITGTGSLRVTIASDNTAFSVNAVQSGTWNITNLSQFGGFAINLGAGAASTGTLRVTQASDSPLVAVTGTTTDAAAANGAGGTLSSYLRSIKDAATDVTTPSPISAPTITKGTQSANGLSVQELKDGGRSALCMTAQFSFAQTAETLLTMTLSADGAATTTFSSRVITSGKKFRIQSVSAIIESLGSGTAPQRAYLRLRRNTAGATTASSALQTVWGFVNSTAVVKSATIGDYEVPDGLEMNGDGTATFGFTLETPDWVTTTATGRIKITVIGFEF